MVNLFLMGGFFMWPLLILFIFVIAISIKKVLELFLKNTTSTPYTDKGINAILFWGGFSFILGVLAHFTGIYQAMEAIAAASDISPAIVAKGYAMSLITVLFGLITLLISAIMWFILRWRLKNLTLKTGQN